MLARLPNGTRVVIRNIRAEDKGRLSVALGRLSLASAHSRFLSPKHRFSTRELVYLTEVDGDRHAALVAVLVDDPEQIVAVGRYVRSSEDPSTAEIAIVVGDFLHGNGLGRRLGLLLADHARRHGVKRFTATMLSDNLAAHRLFAAIAGHLHAEHQAGVDELVAELAA